MKKGASLRASRTMCLAIAFGVALTSGMADGKDIFVGVNVPTASTPLDRAAHRKWHQLLQRYVDKNGMVDYRAWHNSTKDKQQLTAYLGQLSNYNPDLPASRDGKLAFWINAYNSLTVSGILREYPTTSIRNHTARLFGYNIWKNYKLFVGGEAYSLEQIEHEILRKLNEPRIHFAIVCASKGCPRLLNQAYETATLQQQLQTNTLDFFQRTQNFQYDAVRNEYKLSAIFKWFSEDFGSDRTALLKRIAPWLPAKARTAASDASLRGKAKVTYLGYDWTLNAQPGS